MGIHTFESHLTLDDHVTVEDAELLLQLLRQGAQAATHRAIDMAACSHIHAAALQVLLALRPRVIAMPLDPHLASALAHLKEEPPCQV